MRRFQSYRAVNPSGRKPELQMARSDRVLASLGVLCAGISVAFAGYMFEAGGEATHVNGIAHLGIFAMPKTALSARARVKEADSAVSRLSRADGLDMAPTGSIASDDVNANSASNPIRPPSYVIFSANAEQAWLMSNLGFARYRPGDNLPGVGRILSIQSIGGKWRLETTGGMLSRMAVDSVSSEGASRPPPGFSRSLIFDGP
jgi:hypothetical protein